MLFPSIVKPLPDVLISGGNTSIPESLASLIYVATLSSLSKNTVSKAV